MTEDKTKRLIEALKLCRQRFRWIGYDSNKFPSTEAGDVARGSIIDIDKAITEFEAGAIPEKPTPMQVKMEQTMNDFKKVEHLFDKPPPLREFDSSVAEQAFFNNPDPFCGKRPSCVISWVNGARWQFDADRRPAEVAGRGHVSIEWVKMRSPEALTQEINRLEDEIAATRARLVKEFPMLEFLQWIKNEEGNWRERRHNGESSSPDQIECAQWAWSKAQKAGE